MRRTSGALGELGKLEFWRDSATLALLTCYANPCISVLHQVVPIPTWPNAAQNEPHYFGPLESEP